MMTLFVLLQLAEKRQLQIASISRLKNVLLASPWMLHNVLKVAFHFSLFLITVLFSLLNQKKALPCAVAELESRLSSQRAYRTHRYDVYVPKEINKGQTLKAIILIPGALVTHDSYSELAGILSDDGFLVVVPSMEPCLFADPALGADMGSIRRIMKKTMKELALAEADIEWSLMGHSMGAFASMRLYDHFQKYDGDIKIRNLVMLGAAPFIEECTNLSTYNDPKENRILLIQASNDALVEMLGERENELYAMFPSDALLRKDLAGATHHGFASYDANEKYKGEEGITPEEQKKKVAALASKFLQG